MWLYLGLTVVHKGILELRAGEADAREVVEQASSGPCIHHVT